MQFFLNQAVLKYDINYRQLTETDFFSICEKENIEILWSDDEFSFHLNYNNRNFIVISKRTRGLKRLFQMFHELAHAFHSGVAAESVFFHGQSDTQNETEADLFAIICILPLSALASYEFLEDNPNKFARKLYRNRQRIYFLHGI